eukprot:TRINITY_DN6465_c0_g1_i1.p1 TRINITY_DN6465_c0_g1~~TRINITY_DN6465_c0_g1_i1.p1  ORF type:complete len:205 (-),score=33.59 TRINITY_DN6465_c0_g1_i1:120-734(-)
MTSSSSINAIEKVSTQLANDIHNLNDFTEKQLSEFVEIAMAFLLRSSSQQELCDKFIKEHGIHEKPLKATLTAVLYFFSEALKKNLSATLVNEDLISLGLSTENAASLSEKWKKNFAALSTSIAAKTLTVNELVDLEWKFGVTASNSETKEVGACFLQLKLVLNKGSNQKENVLMELSVPQFYQFLQQMQAAQRQCDQISSESS